MSIRWDSLRSHNGCLALFELCDLTDRIRRLAVKHEQERSAAAASTSAVPMRQYRFKRVTPMDLLREQEERRRKQLEAAAQGGGGSAASTQRRVLLPAVQTEDEAAVGTDIASFLEVHCLHVLR